MEKVCKDLIATRSQTHQPNTNILFDHNVKKNWIRVGRVSHIIWKSNSVHRLVPRLILGCALSSATWHTYGLIETHFILIRWPQFIVIDPINLSAHPLFSWSTLFLSTPWVKYVIPGVHEKLFKHTYSSKI